MFEFSFYLIPKISYSKDGSEFTAWYLGVNAAGHKWCMHFNDSQEFPVTILGRPSRSALTVPLMFSYESMDRSGKALCLGETVILPEEINPFISILRHYDIMFTELTITGFLTTPVSCIYTLNPLTIPFIFCPQHIALLVQSGGVLGSRYGSSNFVTPAATTVNILEAA